MKQKGLAPIIIVLLIAAAIGGFLIYSGKINLNQTTTQVAQPSPTPGASGVPTGDAETANWKTYTNSEYKFSFKYPENWNNIIPSEGIDSLYSVQLSDGTRRGPNVGHIFLVVWFKPQDSSYNIDELLKKQTGAVEKGVKSIKTFQEKLTIDGYPAVMVISETTPGYPTEPSYSFSTYIKGPINMVISGQAERGKEDFIKNSLIDYRNILSTFKFTN